MSVSAKLIWRIVKPNIYQSYVQQKKIRQLPIEEIKKKQWDRLVALLTYVEKNSTFYHEQFKKINFDINNFKSYDDLRKIPIIDKKTLKINYDNIITKGSSKQDYVVSNTSGSTGEPFPFLIDKKREPHRTFAAFMLNKEHVGLNPFKKQNELMVKIHPVNEIKDLQKKILRGIAHSIKYYFTSETFGLRSVDINEKNIESIYAIIKKYKIYVIYGYSSNVFTLAKLLKNRNKEINLKSVILIAEGILNQQKKLISEIFNCPVYMDYGSSECMRMGFECKKCDGYHMDLYNYYFEYLDDNGKLCKPGENANIVVTNLNNYIFPLIRYKIGDQCIVSPKNCLCDLNYPIVSSITGRTSDIIKTPSNIEIPLLNLRSVLQDYYDFIFQYQIVVYQKKNIILIKIIPTKQVSLDLKEQIKKRISELLHHSMTVEIEIVKNIEFDKNGKTKTIIMK